MESLSAIFVSSTPSLLIPTPILPKVSLKVNSYVELSAANTVTISPFLNGIEPTYEIYKTVSLKSVFLS